MPKPAGRHSGNSAIKNKAMHPFTDRKLVIATRHRKEAVLAPILEEALGVRCIIPDDFDSDRFGTFSGEVERLLDPVSAAREKCLAAMHETGCDLGLASEGSFGPHPTLFFLSADEEFLLFIDRKHGLEVVVREISADTNFNAGDVSDTAQLLEFARAAGFPEHGLILRKSGPGETEIHKGIHDKDELVRTFLALQAGGTNLSVETDMRAMHNPTRMKVIEKAAYKLIEAIRSRCPACSMPGYVLTDIERGLPCELCGSATRGVLMLIRVCRSCGHRTETKFPDGRLMADPGTCDFCNP